MEGQQETWSARIPVTLEIAEQPPVCGIAGGGRLDFGRAEVRRSSAITMDPVQGHRTYSGSAKGAVTLTPYGFARMNVDAHGTSVAVTVRAPEKLQSGSSSVDFTSLLAYRTASQRAWTLLLKGSGSRDCSET